MDPFWAPFWTPFGLPFWCRFGTHSGMPNRAKTQGNQSVLALLGDPEGLQFGAQNGANSGAILGILSDPMWTAVRPPEILISSSLRRRGGIPASQFFYGGTVSFSPRYGDLARS